MSPPPRALRLLALLALLAAGLLPSLAGAKDRPMRPLPKLAGYLGVSAKETERGVRRAYQGNIARIEPLPDDPQGWVVVLGGDRPLKRRGRDPRSPAGGESERPVTPTTPDRDRFTLHLPEGAAVPFAPGDELRAEIWIVEVGAYARDTHARLWRNGKPLLFVNEIPEGWTAVAGAVVDASRAPLMVRAITFTPASGEPFHAAGFVTGTVGGVLMLAYGAVTRWEGKRVAGPGSPMEPPPNDFASTFATALLWAQPN